MSLDGRWTAGERAASGHRASSCHRAGVRTWMPISRSIKKNAEREEAPSVRALFLQNRRSTYRRCYRRLPSPTDDSPLAPGADSSVRPDAGESGQTRRRPMDARGIHDAAPARMIRGHVSEKPQVRWGAPPGTRTPNPLIKRWRNYLLYCARQCRQIPVGAGPDASPLASVIGRAGLCWLGLAPMDAHWTHNPIDNFRPRRHRGVTAVPDRETP